MAHAIVFRLWVLSAVLLGVSIFCCNLGKADEDEPETGTGIAGGVPQTGTGIAGGVPQTGTGIAGGVPQTGTGIGGGVPQTGTGVVYGDPADIVAKALLCFNNKYIYSSCEEAYRLTEAGNLNVPPEYVDSYCSGPCLSETHLVLNCIENIMKNFVFYNKATIEAVRDTIKAGCSHGLERGNFDVSEHLEDEENSAFKTTSQILLGLGFMFAGRALLL